MITSRQNSKIQLIKRLLVSRRKREQENAFLLEGVRLIEEAVAASWEIRFVLYSHELSDRGNALLDRIRGSGVEVDEVSSELMKEIATTETPQGIVAVLSSHRLPVTRPLDFCLVADGIRDPGNMGTLLRTAASAGVQVVLAAPGTVDAFSPKVLRAGMGAHFRLPLLELEWAEMEAFLRQAHPKRMQVYRTDVRAGRSIWDVDFTQPTAIIIGNEAEGVSEEGARTARDVIHIPMGGMAESLNASIAAGIILYEVVRQRNKDFKKPL